MTIRPELGDQDGKFFERRERTGNDERQAQLGLVILALVVSVFWIVTGSVLG